MAAFEQTIQNMTWNIFHRVTWVDVADIILVAVIIYKLLMLTRQTRGSAVLKGMVFLLVIVEISSLLGFTALNWMLMTVINNGVLVLVILFQPEIRKILEQLGRGTFLEKNHDGAVDENERIIREIIQCCKNLSRRKVGLLIVFEQKTGLKDVCETGIDIDARITAALLENIFEPKTPLHDGAVVIRGERIVSAACILPLTESSVSHELGTRHRAAIGVTETTDSISLIVSEETGAISYAQSGAIYRHLDEQMLRDVLETVYKPVQHSFRNALRKTGKKNKEDAA